MRCVVRCLPILLTVLAAPLAAQQPIDSAYTAKIKEYLRDPRISTELVDHLPASSTVPTPLQFHGRIVGTPGELTYAKDIQRYFEALDKASPRVKEWVIGKSEEGRDMIVLVVADEQTIANLDQYKQSLDKLTDPRRTNDTEARALIQQAKPIYWITSGMHSTETGGPEMLQELAYRLAVEETPLVQSIRNNVITMITPVIEVDGREKQVDTYYFNKKRDKGDARLPLMYWGKYVAHDNNRDHVGQFLALSKNVTRFALEWHPTILHDLHEAQTYLYTSTGTGPYNEALDAITVDEWWVLAQNEIMEMTKRGVPGVWTYGFYDGWVPNYMFFAAHAHNATGRFYEVQSYGPDTTTVRPGATVTSREWFRPNPPLASIAWGPRNNTNIQESAILFALQHVANSRTTFLENYWLKNKRAAARGATTGTYAWVIPAAQHRKQEAADVVNSLRFQGLEFHRATSDFKAGDVQVKAGDYIVRGDQPFRTIADMYFSVQQYAPSNPRPYDDTGWTYQYMRNITLLPIADKSILTQPMSPVGADVVAAGGVNGDGSVVVVENNSDNNLMAFRMRFAKVKMSAAEDTLSVGGHRFAPGAIVIANANRDQLDAALKQLGLSGWATSNMPDVRTHDLDLPRIGYIHAWQRTQDEGWVRAALDTYGVPYTYFSDQKLRAGNLRAKYDVIVYPHVGGNLQSMINGIAKTGKAPLPYKKTAATPSLGALDQSDDIRGGMGLEGLVELKKFVEAGGTLITEGSTATIFPGYNITNGITVENSDNLFARGSIMRGRITDKGSPIVYGYEGAEMPVYFNQDPVLTVTRGGGFAGGGGAGSGLQAQLGQNITPMATKQPVSSWPGSPTPSRASRDTTSQQSNTNANADTVGRPRVIMQFPTDTTQMLLSGTLAGGRVLSGKAQVVDAPVGDGHVVMFAIRPMWRWQTQGTFMLVFNTIMNWNDLNATSTPAPPRPTATH